MRRVLIIRSLEDALPLAQTLEEEGIATCVHPLYEPQFYPPIDLENPQALIITSKNALRAIDSIESLKTVPLYVVGDQTARFARDQGYKVIHNASGTSEELLQLILKKASPDQGILWHLSGKVMKGDLVGSLCAHEFEARRQVVYEMCSPQTLPEALYSALSEKKISHILFFSPHTTKIFVSLIKKCGLEDKMHSIEALCLSKDVEDEVQGTRWKKIWVSPQPTQKSLTGYFHEEKQKNTACFSSRE